jgi:hypothetical protein
MIYVIFIPCPSLPLLDPFRTFISFPSFLPYSFQFWTTVIFISRATHYVISTFSSSFVISNSESCLMMEALDRYNFCYLKSLLRTLSFCECTHTFIKASEHQPGFCIIHMFHKTLSFSLSGSIRFYSYEMTDMSVSVHCIFYLFVLLPLIRRKECCVASLK